MLVKLGHVGWKLLLLCVLRTTGRLLRVHLTWPEVSTCAWLIAQVNKMLKAEASIDHKRTFSWSPQRAK